MSEENVEVVRQMSEAFRSRDWAAAFEPVDPEIEMDATRVPSRASIGFTEDGRRSQGSGPSGWRPGANSAMRIQS